MKKIVSLIVGISVLTMTMLSAFPVTVSATGDTSSRPPAVDNEDLGVRAPELYVYSVETRIVSAGEAYPFNFVVGNRTGYIADKVRISIEGDGDKASLFRFEEGAGYIEANLGYENKSISTRLKVSPQVKDGSYKLNFKFSYVDYDNNKVERTDSCMIYVQSRNENAPYIKGTSFDKKEIGKENKAKMSVNLYNPTAYPLTDFRISLNSADSKEFTLYENFQPVTVTTIAPGATKNIVFSTYVASTVMSGNYPVKFDISYRDNDGGIVAYSEVVYIQVKRTADAEGGDKDTTGTPRIIVAKYSTDVEEIKAGQTFTLDFTLQNTSSTTPVKNMKVVLGSVQTSPTGQGNTSTGGDVFFPAAGSNSFFIETLGTKQTSSNQIKLMARKDVEPGVYQVTLDLDYEDSNGKAFKSEENIAFSVAQELRLDMNGFNVPSTSSFGMSIPINFQYINKGKSTISNFSINIEGDFTLDGGDAYIGNLTAGYNDYYDGMIMPKGEGEQKGALVLKYEDANGNAKEQKKEFTCNIMPMSEGDGSINIGGGKPGMVPGGQLPDGMMIDPVTGELVPKTGGFPWVWVIIGGVVVIGGGLITFLVIKKKRKAKKELMIDEED